MKNIVIAVIISAFCFAACTSKKEEQGKTSSNANLVTLTDAQLKNSAIKTGTVTTKDISETFKLNGKIDVPPQNMISICMPLGGYLKATQLLPGMHLSKGEIIATLEDQQYVQLQQDYLTTKSKLKFAEKEFERQKELNRSQASSDKIFQQAEAEYNTLKITLKGLEEKLKLININTQTLSDKTISKSVYLRAPIDCYVSKVNVNIGKYVTPSDILFELINPLDIHLNLSVFEKDLNKLSIGQKVMAFTNTRPDKKYACEIILISKDLSLQDHSAEVHCHFEKYDKSLYPGMYMNAEIETKTTNSAVLPEAAIVNFEGKEFIFVVAGKNQYQMTAIKTGNSENGFVEILGAGNFKNSSIVTQGAYTLLMQLKNKSDE